MAGKQRYITIKEVKGYAIIIGSLLSFNLIAILNDSLFWLQHT